GPAEHNPHACTAPCEERPPVRPVAAGCWPLQQARATNPTSNAPTRDDPRLGAASPSLSSSSGRRDRHRRLTPRPSSRRTSRSPHHLRRHLSRWDGGSGIGAAGSSVRSARNVESSPSLILIVPVSRPSLPSRARPVPDIGSYSHAPFH